MGTVKKLATDTVVGLVLPDEWDDDFENIVAVVIDGDDGETYRVSREGVGKRLLDFADLWVEAVGTVEEVDGELVLTVRRFSELDERYAEY